MGFFEGVFNNGQIDQNEMGILFIYQDQGKIESFPAYFVLFQKFKVARITTPEASYTLSIVDALLSLKTSQGEDIF